MTADEIQSKLITLPPETIHRLLGWKTHNRRSRYGHYFVAGKCQDCGLTFQQFAKRRKGTS